MKIKIFEFEVSNAACSPIGDDKKTLWFEKTLKKLDDEYYIEETLNSFLEKVDVINVFSDVIPVHYHNNGRGNTIHIIYTVLYNERG